MFGIVPRPDSQDKDYLFRVALKAVILNEKNEILVVKESGRDWWDLPGGGLDHGESLKQGLARELLEEVGYEGDFTFDPIEVSEPQLLERLSLYQVRIMFLVKTDTLHFSRGRDSDAVEFVDPELFRNTDSHIDKEIYRYYQKALENKAKYHPN